MHACELETAKSVSSDTLFTICSLIIYQGGVAVNKITCDHLSDCSHVILGAHTLFFWLGNLHDNKRSLDMCCTYSTPGLKKDIHVALEANMIPPMIPNKRSSLDWLNEPGGLKMSLFPRKTFVTSIHGALLTNDQV